MKNSATFYKFSFVKILFLAAGALIIATFFSCNTVKKVHKGEYLLAHNHIIYRFGSASKNKRLTTDIKDIGEEGIEKFEVPQRVNAAAVLPYVKQKPNTKILFIFPFYLYLYDLPDSANTAIAKARRDSVYIVKAKKKGWSQKKLKRKTDRLTGREWLMSQGEPPVILDSFQIQRSTEQIRTFLFYKGYFDADVKDSVHIGNQKANVSYIIRLGKPYKINSVRYLFEDPGLASTILADTANCKIRKNDIFDQDNIDAERDRLTTELNNTGYYYFSKQYVSYKCDTDCKTHLIDVNINIKKFVRRDKFNKDSVIETNHIAYHIRHIIMQMDYDPSKIGSYHPGDSIVYNGIDFVYLKNEITVKPNILRPKIFISPGDIYKVDNRENTYAGLSQLNEFSYVSIKYTPVTDSNYLDCYIQLMPIEKHSVGAELEGTNTGGDLGVQSDISYANYNQFNGAEKLQFKLNGGLIAQEVFTSNNGTLLNTEDLGPELDFMVPRPLFPYNDLLQVFPFNSIHYTNPQTVLKLTFDYQLRLDYYVRHVLGLSYGLDFDSHNKHSHFTIALFEWNLVNASLTPQFDTLLNQYNLFFRNSFQNQVITDGRLTYIYTNQNTNNSVRQSHFRYWKFDFECSGWALSQLKDVLHLPLESGSYYIEQFNAPYSQYLKLDGEFRWYWYLDKLHKQQIATRLLGGFGVPYGNSTELPFTKSFWAGGSNDIRAWPIQELGPGGSPSSSSPVAGQVGETKLEGNIEYRVKLVRYFDFAWFIDAGNIWLLKSKANESIPLAYMQLSGPNSFINEMAIGMGPGFRFDFDYFIVRVDLGEPVRDPSQPADHRLLSLHDYSIHKTVLNIGIGYPF